MRGFFMRKAERKKIMKNRIRTFIFLAAAMLTAAVFLGQTGNVAYARDFGAEGMVTVQNADTGVDGMDAAMDRGEKFIKSILKFIGVLVALVAFVFFLISFPTHQSEQRTIALIGFVVGVGIFFSPEIVNYILGR